MMFSAAPTLAKLKDFQLTTVEHVFRKLFDADSPARRYLVADEVGLGKTLVAKGIVAKVIEALQDNGQVNVVYVCSNQDIARQNIDRLRIEGVVGTGQDAALATRLTLLPLELKKIASPSADLAVNFISFTPGTSFSSKQRTGRQDERRLIYHMLREIRSIDRRGLLNALCATATHENWKTYVERDPGEYDLGIAQAFAGHVASDTELMQQIHAVCHSAYDRRRTETKEAREERLSLTGELRRRLARICIERLRPDLVILDEFQRFSELLAKPEDNPSAELANDLFSHEGLRILLLSATPYRMYSMAQDEEDHYTEFMGILRFLLMAKADCLLPQLAEDLKQFRSLVLDTTNAEAGQQLASIKRRIEAVLRSVMCRTERVGWTATADAMVREEVVVPRLLPSDLQAYASLEKIARDMKEPDTIEYWKSSPYLLQFMKEYELKKSFQEHVKTRPAQLAKGLAPCVGALHCDAVEGFRQIDMGNARLRALVNELSENGFFRLVWIPPSVAYWKPEGAYEHAGSISKQLIFSSWNVVPDAIAALLSYEAERHVMPRERKFGYAGMPKRMRPRIVFARKEGRLSGMLNLMLMLPSPVLAGLADPAQRCGVSSAAPDFETVHSSVVAKLRTKLDSIVRDAPTTGNEDLRWYWVALARLEAHHHPWLRRWCEQDWHEAAVTLHSGDENEEAQERQEKTESLFDHHVAEWLRALDGRIDDLGRVPADLAEVLAEVALCGPGTCALRTLARSWQAPEKHDADLLTPASLVAWGLRSQFNSPRITALLVDEADEDSYWRKVLHYCRDGNLQAVFDEYAHCVQEAAGASSGNPEDASLVARQMYEAMSLRTVLIHPDEIRLSGGIVQIADFLPPLRSHFAVRFDSRSDEEKASQRKQAVKAAFNSPFAPFVLASTSIGQEGLDFHMWCHSVVHWNLPTNPVDLEQREGRVHRYRGYAVRKNVAAKHAREVLGSASVGADVWRRLFEAATGKRPPGTNDLIPNWIYEVEGGAKVERRVMATPFSREDLKYRQLRRSLALYRMVFAQPRQEEFLACLEQAAQTDQQRAQVLRWKIDLAPSTFTNMQFDIRPRDQVTDAPKLSELMSPPAQPAYPLPTED